MYALEAFPDMPELSIEIISGDNPAHRITIERFMFDESMNYYPNGSDCEPTCTNYTSRITLQEE
jgi:hypothetical protein